MVSGGSILSNIQILRKNERPKIVFNCLMSMDLNRLFRKFNYWTDCLSCGVDERTAPARRPKRVAEPGQREGPRAAAAASRGIGIGQVDK